MQETAAVLAKIDGQMAGLYAVKSGMAPEAVAALMDAETWFTSAEAVDAGLADGIAEPADKTGAGARALARAGAPVDAAAVAAPAPAPLVLDIARARSRIAESQ
jgi:hypothetical protein